MAVASTNQGSTLRMNLCMTYIVYLHHVALLKSVDSYASLSITVQSHSQGRPVTTSCKIPQGRLTTASREHLLLAAHNLCHWQLVGAGSAEALCEHHNRLCT